MLSRGGATHGHRGALGGQRDLPRLAVFVLRFGQLVHLTAAAIHIAMADATRTLDARLTMTRLRSVVLMLEGDSLAIRSGQMTARLSYHRAIPSPKKKGG